MRAQCRPLRLGNYKQHAKLWVTDRKRTCEAVLWNVDERSLPVGRFDLAFAPDLNRYQGNTRAQLKVLDWQPAVSDTPGTAGREGA